MASLVSVHSLAARQISRICLQSRCTLEGMDSWPKVANCDVKHPHRDISELQLAQCLVSGCYSKLHVSSDGLQTQGGILSEDIGDFSQLDLGKLGLASSIFL